MTLKTATILAYMPHGTKSAICIEVQYRYKTRHQLTGPKADRETLLKKAREWAKNAGFTHSRFFGESVVTKL